MSLFVALLALSVAGVTGTIFAVLRDGLRARPTVASRIPDRDPVAPAVPSSADRTQEKAARRPVPALRARRVS
ncbi:hypothetical protein ACIQLJ_03840 [Microbacterium sp. NPDC091313]